MYGFPPRPGPPPPTAFAQPPPQLAQQQPPSSIYVPPPPPVAAIGPGLFSQASGSVSTLRLKLADDIRIEPPIAVSAALLPSSGPQATPSLDLALERQLAGCDEKEGEGEGSGGGERGASGAATSSGSSSSSSKSDVKAFLSNIQAGELPQDPAIKKVVAMGVQPAPAALGVMHVRPTRGHSEKAAEFASKCEQLTGMGFSLALSAGALAKHKGDLEAATESCLAIAS